MSYRASVTLTIDIAGVDGENFDPKTGKTTPLTKQQLIDAIHADASSRFAMTWTVLTCVVNAVEETP